jgi:hypothetical protein
MSHIYLAFSKRGFRAAYVIELTPRSPIAVMNITGTSSIKAKRAEAGSRDGLRLIERDS